MTLRPPTFAVVALAGLVASSASAGDRTHERLERALAARRAARAEPSARAQTSAPSLATALAELERRDRTQRAEFDAASARDLPPKAAERLARTRAAWEAGQGRLLRLMRRLAASETEAARAALPEAAAPSAPGRPSPTPSTSQAPARASDRDLNEALSLLRRFRAAARTEPLSAGELKVTAPELLAPALSVGPGTEQAPGDAAPIGSIAPELRRMAESFDGPVAVYEWVRNAIRPEFYHGVMKGPRQTLLEASGNDADTASLLIALLRARGLPARYVRGTVDLPASVAVAITGTSSPERALRVFQRAGIPSEAQAGVGAIEAIRVERVWAEAYIPYVNYRGVLLDAHEKTWVPLDAGFKRLEPAGGLDVRTLGFEPESLFEEYLTAPVALTPRELARQRVEALLAAQSPGTSYEEVLVSRGVLAQNLGLLPSTLPYAIEARAEVGYDPPPSLVHTARFVVESDQGSLVDAVFSLPDLLGQRLTLSYVPFEEDDEAVVAQYGGLFQTPPYLVEVRPVLKSGGVVVSSGTGGAGLGVKLDFRVELTTPGGSGTVANRVLAGNLTAIGLAAGPSTTAEEGDDEAARILSRLAFRYLDRWNTSDSELAALLRVVPVRPTVSTCLVQSAVNVAYAGGDPLYPLEYDWKGLAIDADRRPSAPVGIESDDAERDFLLLSGLEGSVLENRLFQDDLGITAVSTTTALQLAPLQGIAVLDLGADAETVLPGLPLGDGVKAEILAATASGFRVRVPAAPVTLLAWSGVGYLILDDDSGESAWQLQGGHSGGVTAPAVIDLPAELVDAVRRQSESPSPNPKGVSFIQKFGSTDFQSGTVGTALTKALKVLVTDEEGFPVPGAPVTFSVLGGGGALVDPASGRANATDVTVLSCVGGEEAGVCATLKPGEAVASFHLGLRTDAIPRFTCEEPFTCTCPESGACDRDTVGYSTQVGLNLVTAYSAGAVLPEPFTAVGYPEKQPVDGGFQVFVRLANPPQYNPVNLTVIDQLALDVTDRHGNPLSNVWMRAAFDGPPVLGPAPPGGSLFREATTTPGHVLNRDDYDRCVATQPSVIWGQCVGEAETVNTRSSSQGVFFYPIVGDSPWSLYFYDFGTPADPSLVRIGYHTNGYSCRHPDPSQCAAYDQPLTFVWQGTRGTQTNALGNRVEAYSPGAPADVGLWADIVFEEAEVVPYVDGEGQERFRVKGTNVWRRERLLDSEIALSSLTPGTAVDATALHRGDGIYGAPMTLAGVPGLNTVAVSGTHFAPLIKYVNGITGDVDPSTVNASTLTVERVKDEARPISIEDTFSLWGVDAQITGVDPAPVFLGSGGTVTRSAIVQHDIQPPEYQALLAPGDVRLDVLASEDNTVVLTGSGADLVPFEIPAGLALPAAQYHAQLRLRGVSSGGVDLPSGPHPLPVCSLLDLRTPQVEVRVVRDPLNQRLCGSAAEILFVLCRDARVTLTVAGESFTTSINESAPVPVVDLVLPAGVHTALVPAGLPELDALDYADFSIQAQDLEDPTQTALAQGVVKNVVLNRSVLPVGRTFVKGVDLLDGHMVHQATDLQVPGRHLGLELTRTYSSAGSSSHGPLGGGWAFGYTSRLYEDPSCGIATVVTADGSSQVFQSSDGLQTFEPQKGYHTELTRDGLDAYVFKDKAGNEHRFDKRDPQGARRLEFIEEPHGDQLFFGYDGASRLTRVGEVHPESGEVRALQFEYETLFGFDRIVRATSPGLSLAVQFGYDERGNLTSATRSGENLPGASGPATAPRVERYEYVPPRPLSPHTPPPAGGEVFDTRRDHQLGAIVDPNGSRREYVYFTDDDPPLPGEAEGRLPSDPGGVFFTHRFELVKQVLEFPAPGLTERTAFTYDGSDSLSSRWTTTVRDGRGHDTVYLLNGNGSPLEIREPLGRMTEMRWATDDIFKIWEKDALGRETDFEYDARGNLILERILTGDFGPVVTQYAYDPSFNKLTDKTDAESRHTHYEIHPDTGDLLEMTDAVGNLTVYAYDAHGRLESVTDPRTHVTSHTDHDSFGNARTVTDPLGNVTSRVWDVRGRLLQQSDTLGRDMQQAWDGLDRPFRVTRVAGGASDDETTETDYYPGGQPRLVRNANGAETTFTLDGLNRVVATETRFDTTLLTTATTWDATGNKETETDRRGVTRRNTWDALNRLENVEIVAGLPSEGPVGSIAGYTYDLVGNRLTETDLAGLTTTFKYDDLYRVETRILPESHPTTGLPYRETFRYDLVGNVLEQTDANEHLTAHLYDGLDRRLQTTNALFQVTTFAYDDPEASESHVNLSEEHDLTRGLKTTYRYDALNRETERVVHLDGAGGGGVAYTTGIVYDDVAHTATVTDTRGFQTLTRLDGLDRPVEQTVDPPGLALVTRTAYDGLGNPKSVVDPNDHDTTFRHDGLGRQVEVTDADGEVMSYEYDGEALKTRETDRRGIQRVFTYDNVGRPRTESLASAPRSGVPWSRETRYLDRQRQRIETNARGHATTFDLDGLNRVVQETDALGFFRTFVWDGVNRLEETDKRDAPGGGHYTTVYEYDDLNRLLSVTDALDQVATTLYEDALNRRTDTDKRDILTVTQLDPLGRVVSVTRAGGFPEEAVLETNEYDGNSNQELTTDAEGRQTRFVYDAANRLEARTDGLGTPAAAVTRFLYDGVGNVLEELDARAAALGEPWSIQRTYDVLDRLKTETNGEGNVMVYGYDEEGNRTSVQEPAGQLTSFDYGELGELLTVTQAIPEPGESEPVTAYVYDENRNLTRQTDARGTVVRMEYDVLDRLEKTIQDPTGFALITETTRFDKNGNPEEVVDPKGQTTTHTYDELNRLKTTAYAFAPGDTTRPWRYTAGLTYGYDENDNLRQVDESVASGPDPPDTTLITLRAYDKLDRLESETTTLPNGGTQTVEYSYYRNGTRETVTDPAGLSTRYTYDGKNRLETATTAFGTPEAAQTTYAYFPDDLLERCLYPNGVSATHTYDKADRLLSVTNANGPTLVSSYEYFGLGEGAEPVSYDENGNRLIQVETNGGVTETTRYAYDGLNRLETIRYPADSTFPSGRDVEYDYDAVGNRIGEIEREPGGPVLANRQGIFDSLNRLETLTDLSKPDTDPEHRTAFTWDPNGNQTTKTVGTGPGAVTTTFLYDLRDKLVQADQATAATPEAVATLSRFQYDFQGRRNLKIGELIDGGTLRQYVYDQTSLLAEYNAAGTPEAKYDYGSDRLLSLTRTDEGRRYYSLDGLRSVVNLTNDTGLAAASYHLDAWGNFRFPTELDDSKNRFAFTGHYYDPETKLYNAKARYFDPKLGRFLTQDSFFGEIDAPPSLHRYLYANANPTTFVDPTGHYSWRQFGQGVKWGADFGTTFYEEFSTGVGETAANIATLGGYGGIKSGYQEGRVTATDFSSAGRAYAEGVFNTITLGAAGGAVGAYAEGEGAGGVALGGLKGAGEAVLPIDEARTLADPDKNIWEKAEAAATGGTKVALLAAGGVAARNAAVRRASGRAGVVTEQRTAATAEASVAPAETVRAPRPVPRGGQSGARASGPPSQGVANNIKGNAFENILDNAARRQRQMPFFRSPRRGGMDFGVLDESTVILREAKFAKRLQFDDFTSITKNLESNVGEILKHLDDAPNISRADKRLIRTTLEDFLGGNTPSNLKIDVVTGKSPVGTRLQQRIRENTGGLPVEFRRHP